MSFLGILTACIDGSTSQAIYGKLEKQYNIYQCSKCKNWFIKHVLSSSIFQFLLAKEHLLAANALYQLLSNGITKNSPTLVCLITFWQFLCFTANNIQLFYHTWAVVMLKLLWKPTCHWWTKVTSLMASPLCWRKHMIG